MTGYASSTPVKNEKGTWYLTICETCPMCGLSRTYKTRMPAPKPKNDRDRYEYYEYWDYCGAL